MKLRFKYAFLFCIGGILYNLIELLFRGRTHWTMFIVGGVCFILIGLMNERSYKDMPIIWQAINGGIIITFVEFIAGLVCNIILGWDIWDYSNMPFNLLGQICLPFSLLWCLLSIVGIVADDLIRWRFFGEEKPKYRLI